MLGDAAAPLRAADVAVVNLETAVGRGGTPAPKEYLFRAPRSVFAALREIGVDVVSMANNHALDYGRAALVDAVDAGAAAGVPVIGAGRDVGEAFQPYVTTVQGQRVTVLAATQVLDRSLAAAWTATPRKAGMASAKDPAQLLRAVRQARQEGGVVAVYLHWGVEREECPRRRRRSSRASSSTPGPTSSSARMPTFPFRTVTSAGPTCTTGSATCSGTPARQSRAAFSP